MALEDEVRELTQVLRDQSRSGSSGGSSSGGGRSSGGGVTGFIDDLFKPVTSTANALTGAFQKLTIGTFNLNDAVSLVAEPLRAIPVVGGVFANALEKGGGVINLYNDSLSKAADQGAYFGGNLGDFATSVSGARMTMDDYVRFNKENSIQLQGLGLTASDSSKRFLELSRNVQTSDLGNQFLLAGGSAEDLNSALLISTMGMRAADARTTVGQNALIESAGMLTTQIDDLSRATGMSRKQVEEGLKKELAKADVSAYLAGLDKDQQQRAIQSMANMSQFGESITDLGLHLQETGGAITNQMDAQLVTALGPAGIALQEYSAAVKSGVGVEEAKAKFTEEYNKQITNPEFLRLVQQASRGDAGMPQEQRNAILKMYNESMTKNLALNDQITAARQGEIKTTEEARIAREKATAEQKKAALEDPNAALQRTLNASKNIIYDTGVEFNTMFKQFNKFAGDHQADLKKILDTNKSIMSEQGSIWSEIYKGLSGETPGAPKAAVPPKERSGVVTRNVGKQERALGTLGMTGQLFEPDDFFGKVHKGETVLTKDQFSQIFDSSKNININQIKGQMNSAMSQFMPMMETFATKISSAQTAMPTLPAPTIQMPAVDNNSGLNDLKQHMMQISTYMGQLVNIADKQVTQLKHVASGVSNSRTGM
jgi:hypothetical protein